MRTKKQGMSKEITGSSPMYKTKKLVERQKDSYAAVYVMAK